MSKERPGQQAEPRNYYFAIHMGLCRGPIDELLQIEIGDKLAYSGSLTASTSISINQPNLFGGRDTEGGIAGHMHYMNGTAVQTIPAEVTSALAGSSPGGLVPQFRGVVTLYYDGLVAQNNPYLKDWKFRIRRSKAGWDGDVWSLVNATIWMGAAGAGPASIHGMNPAHIIYEATTNRVWGRGLPRALLDENSFASVAAVLLSEGLGLCILWTRTGSISTFIAEIIEHIGGALYIDRSTGLLTLKLLRADYDPNDIPSFNYDSGIIEIESDDTGAASENHNEIVVTYHDPITDEDREVRVQNLASIQSLGYVISKKVVYRGVPTADLAYRLAERDLMANANWLKRFKLKLDRRGWQLAPGAAFRISVPSRGIANMILRAGSIDDGPLIEGTVTVKAVQDVFGLAATSYLDYSPAGWTPPDTTAYAATMRMVLEATYRSYVVRLTAAELATVASTRCTLAAYARSPSFLSLAYRVATKVAPEEYLVRNTGNFVPSVRTTSTLDLYGTTVTFDRPKSVRFFQVGKAVFVGTELCRITAIDFVTRTLTVARGCGDSLPVTHAIAEPVWLADGHTGTDFRDYVPGEVVFVKMLTTTSADTLAVLGAPEDSVVMAQRFFRPYPPGNFRINGVRYADVTASVGDTVLTWAHRDRVGQQDRLIEHGAGNEGPEVGQTYTVRVYSNADALLRTVAGVGGTTWTYTDALWATDGSPTQPRFELESRRDGLASLMLYSRRIARS